MVHGISGDMYSASLSGHLHAGETIRQQDDTLLNALNWEIEGMESGREEFLFAPPTRATPGEPDDILLSSTADDLIRINPEEVDLT